MPSLLGLLLCTALVVLFLAVERRASGEVSAAVWIPTIWMMMMASRPLDIWFGARETQGLAGGNEAGSVIDRWLLMVLAIIAITIFAHRRFDWSGSLRRNKWLVMLLAYMLVSTFWSAFTLIAARRWVREAITLVMALLLMSEANPRQAVASVLRRSAYVLIPFSLVLIKYYPALGRAYGRWSGDEMWTGVTGQKNQLGRLCMITAFFLLWELYRRWREHSRVGVDRYQTRADVAVLLMALYLLKGSDSHTSMVTLAVGVVSYLSLRLLCRLKLAVPQAGLLAVVIFLIVFGTATSFVGGANVGSFTASLGRDSTLTGRTEVWADVLPAREQQPVLGYGLGSFWTDARRKSYDIPTAHNGYLDILLELGEVGLAVYAVLLLSFARRLHRALPHDYEWSSLAICFLLMGLVYNISESALNSFTEHMTAVMTLASLVVPCQTRSRTECLRDQPAAIETGAGLLTRETWPEWTLHDAWSEPMATDAEHAQSFADGFSECSHPEVNSSRPENSVFPRTFLQ
jgi:O-antigen ligase